MSGYIEAGYVIVLGSLSLYAASVLRREHAARLRLSRPVSEGGSTPAHQTAVEPLRRDDDSVGEP